MSKPSSPDACRVFRSRMSEMDSEATPEESAEAERHRSACADCEAEYQLAMRMERGLAALAEIAPDSAGASLEDRMFRATAAMIGRTTLDADFDPTKPVAMGISCREFTDALGDFVSEELAVGMMLEGVEHASECRPCGDQLAELQTIQDACRSLAEVEPPASIWTSLMARIEAEEAAQGEASPDPAKKTATARTKLLPVLG